MDRGFAALLIPVTIICGRAAPNASLMGGVGREAGEKKPRARRGVQVAPRLPSGPLTAKEEEEELSAFP
jgi:hypothetical protein